MDSAAIMLMAIAAQGAAAPPAPPLPELRILPPPCRPGGADEIVVCGREEERERQRAREPVPPRGVIPPREDLQLGTDIAGLGRLEPKLMQHVRPDGFVDRALMMTLKIKF